MKVLIFIKFRSGTILRFMAVIIFLMNVVVIPAYAQDVFGFKLDAGIGSTKSKLEKQGYTVHISKNLTYTRLSSIELFGFTNNYLKNMQLWIETYKNRVFLYKWNGTILADKNSAASMDRLLKYITEIFSKPEISGTEKSTYQKIDVSLFKKIADVDEFYSVDFTWKYKTEELKMFLAPSSIPINDMEIEFSLQYSLSDIQDEVEKYKYDR